MSILIKGMEMPTSCYVCPFCDYVSARCDAVKGTPYTPEDRYEKCADFCPLVPVPPHGGLIDADGQIGVNVTMMPGGKCKVDLIAPTVIEAEEGEV